MELLAPAGSPEALVAAVQSGADAVYMGFGDFNARKGARNFSDEAFRAAVSYCHLRGVRVYLTLNTLLTDRELGILRSIAQGLTTPKIAEELHLSPETVKWHRKRMLAKFSATTSAEMVRRAIKAGIL